MDRVKRFLPTETLLVIYNSLVLSHLLYGVLLWGLKSNRLMKLQKRAIRITKSKYIIPIQIRSSNNLVYQN